jgi:hypothetical protein
MEDTMMIKDAPQSPDVMSQKIGHHQNKSASFKKVTKRLSR